MFKICQTRELVKIEKTAKLAQQLFIYDNFIEIAWLWSS